MKVIGIDPSLRRTGWAYVAGKGAPCLGGAMGGGIPSDCRPAYLREVTPGEWLYMTEDWEPEEEEEWE